MQRKRARLEGAVQKSALRLWADRGSCGRTSFPLPMRPHNIEDWSGRHRHGLMAVSKAGYTKAGGLQGRQGKLQVLTVRMPTHGLEGYGLF